MVDSGSVVPSKARPVLVSEHGDVLTAGDGNVVEAGVEAAERLGLGQRHPYLDACTRF